MSTRTIVTAVVLDSAVATALAALAAPKVKAYGVALKGQSDCTVGPGVACDHASTVDLQGHA